MSVIIKGMEMPQKCDDCFLPLRYCPFAMRPDGECPLVEAPEWISVEERLPEIDMYVLVYAIGKIDGFIGDTVIAISRRCVFRLFPWNEGIEVWENPWQYFTTDYEVTHWIPLPEPPKEGKA